MLKTRFWQLKLYQTPQPSIVWDPILAQSRNFRGVYDGLCRGLGLGPTVNQSKKHQDLEASEQLSQAYNKQLDDAQSLIGVSSLALV